MEKSLPGAGQAVKFSSEDVGVENLRATPISGEERFRLFRSCDCQCEYQFWILAAGQRPPSSLEGFWIYSMDDMELMMVCHGQ